MSFRSLEDHVTFFQEKQAPDKAPIFCGFQSHDNLKLFNILRNTKLSSKYSSLFTFRPEPPVFIGIPKGEEFFLSLHPLFTTLHLQERKQMRKTDRRIANLPELKGEEW